MNPAPIALFVYNRPWHTMKTVEALQQNLLAKESHLCIFSDAPRNPDDEASVNEVRKLIHTITGFKSIEIVEREHNLGLDPSILDGVTRLCAQYGRVIVMEDDLVSSSEFLEYMNRALDYFADEKRVMQISGHMFSSDLPKGHAVLLPFITSWGWAVWKRSWDLFDPSSSGYAELRDNKNLRHKFNLNGAYPFYKLLEKVVSGRGDHWDIRWYLSVFLQQGLTLYPPHTLIQNIGFDGSGTNCVAANPSQDSLGGSPTQITFPEQIEISEFYEKIILPAIKNFNLSFRRPLYIRIFTGSIRRIREFFGWALR